MMPPGGAESRAEQIATLERIIHEMLIDPAVADLLDGAESEAGGLDPWQAANLREMRHGWIHAVAVDPIIWTAMRVLTGFAYASLYIVAAHGVPCLRVPSWDRLAMPAPFARVRGSAELFHDYGKADYPGDERAALQDQMLRMMAEVGRGLQLVVGLGPR